MKEKLLAAWALALDKIVTARAWKISMPLADAFIPMLREAFLSRYCNPISPTWYLMIRVTLQLREGQGLK